MIITTLRSNYYVKEKPMKLTAQELYSESGKEGVILELKGNKDVSIENIAAFSNGQKGDLVFVPDEKAFKIAITGNCSAMVIDHDLTFVDFVSDKITLFKGEPSIKGNAYGPYSVDDGMNKLLEYLEITVRRDKETKRPRINKTNSVLDREQKKSGKFYK